MTKKLVTRFIGDGGKALESATDANWLVLAPDKDAVLIPLEGPKDNDDPQLKAEKRSEILSAQTWWVDHMRFHRYDHPLSDLAKDIHVYASVGDLPKVLDAATVGPATTHDGWWTGNIILEDGVRKIQLIRKLDPVDHSKELIDEMIAAAERGDRKPPTLDEINTAHETETERATHDSQRIYKHSWGSYTSQGYGFKIWIAHMRQRAQSTFDQMLESDDKKAWDIRNKAIESKIATNKYITPAVRAVPNTKPEVQPEGDKPEAVTDAEQKDDGRKLIIALIDKKQMTGKKINLYRYTPGEMIWMHRIERNRVIPLNWRRTWDPDNEPLVEALVTFAKDQGDGIGFGVSLSVDAKSVKGLLVS